MGPLRIRPGTSSDAADIARVHVESWRETYAGLSPHDMLASLDVDARRKMWASVLPADGAPSTTSAFVLERADRIVGFAACGDQRSPGLASAGFDGEIGAIYILNEARGLGAGRSLMAASAAALAERGKTGLSLWVLAENKEARGFYERLRGKLVGERSECIEQVLLTEVAYGWPDLNWLTG